MSACDCVALVRLDDAARPDEVRGRVGALASWFQPFGELRSAQRWLAKPRVLAVAIRFASAPPDTKRPLSWGGDLPVALRDTAALLTAGDDALRGLGGPLLAVAAGDDAARAVCASDGPVALYQCDGPGGVTAWCSHAVPAALLAGGTPELDLPALRDCAAFDAPVGRRALIHGVTALDSATVVDIGAEVTVRSAWPFEDRLQALEEDPERQVAPERMLAALERRLGRSTRPAVGLTAGVDARTVACALKAMGITAVAVTVGRDGNEDLAGARLTGPLLLAEALG